MNQTKHLLKNAWWAGVNAVNGRDLVYSELTDREQGSVSHVLAIGKAASAMMLGAHEALAPFKGLLITKYAHTHEQLTQIPNITFVESAHPVPDAHSLVAGQMALDFIRSVKTDDTLLVLISGGASALVELLPNNLSLSDLQLLNQQMLADGNTIHEINDKRSRISLIKKGKLLHQCQAKTILTLAISDVQGDDINVIGSGIGACHLKQAQSKIIGSNQLARKAIDEYLTNRDVHVIQNDESLYGDVFDLARYISQTVIDGPKGAYIFGGEPTIELPQLPGQGGRNQSLALAFAREIKHSRTIHALVAGSDGSDGPSHAAGGLVNGKTFSAAPDATAALKAADAGTYLDHTGDLFVTGPTGTNVMDIVITLKSDCPR